MWLPLAAITCSNWGRKFFIVDLPDEAFSHRSLCAVQRYVTHWVICVAVACLASLFINVRLQAEVERIQIWCLWGSNSLGQKLMLAFNHSCTVFAVCAAQSRIIGAVRGAHSQLWETTLPVFSSYAPSKYDKRFGTPAIVWFTGWN